MNIRLENIKVIFWDFDGVIINSNSIRELGFRTTLNNYPEKQVEALIKYHRVNGGLSRYNKFRYFYETIRNENVDEERITALANIFSDVMRKLLTTKSLLIDETVNFIKEHYNNYCMHIVSGSDEKELNYLCECHSLSKYFISIKGSPTPKNELVKSILINNKYNSRECILIGDSINDYEAASLNGLHFWAYGNDELVKYNRIY